MMRKIKLPKAIKTITLRIYSLNLTDSYCALLTFNGLKI